MFDALLLTQNDDRAIVAQRARLDEAQLPDGDVLVDIAWSTVNYKDALAITGRIPIVRQFPMVPGIDFAGTVLESHDSRYRAGDAVLLNGWGLGEAHWGGLARKARVKADWLVPMPGGMDARRAMAIGTAGYTAMLCVMALQRAGVSPEAGPVLVTGANGGVGTIAISLLARLGFEVHASTGRLNEADYLKQLGATELIDRAYAPFARRAEAWGRLASELPAEITDANTRAITLDEVVDLAPRLLAGQVRGRVVVDVGAG